MFLTWLLDALRIEKIDSLLVAGDIFDSANPPASAQKQWYRLLSQARQNFPTLDIVAIAGNHDSAGRLEAPRALLEEFDIKVFGRLSFNTTTETDSRIDRCIVPLHDSNGKTAAWCAAIPFLRPPDLPKTSEDADSQIDGTRMAFSTVIETAKRRANKGQAVIAMGHCYMMSATLSELSERKIVIGNEHALPADIFDNSAAYIALGHLHLGQTVAGQDRIRYSGSPIPLSMDETDYRHHVCVATIEGNSLVDIKQVPIPRAIEMIRIPAKGAKPWITVRSELAALPNEPKPGQSAEQSPELQLGIFAPPTLNRPKPFLEVRVTMDKPDSTLRRSVDEALKGKYAQLVKLTIEFNRNERSLALQLPSTNLQDLTAESVFVQLYQSNHQGQPSDELLACFRELASTLDQEQEP